MNGATSASRRIHFAAVGDVFLGGEVGKALEHSNALDVFAHIRPHLQEADLTFGNLEAPLTNAPFIHKSGPAFKASPKHTALLASAGFDVFNLANNHIGDCGQAGMQDTLAAVASANISGFGLTHERYGTKPLLLERKGLKVGFLGYCDSYRARSQRYGCEGISAKNMTRDIARVSGIVDCIIVSLHHGIEYSDYPELAIIQLCRQLVDAGADLVLGHHAHVLQGWEEYNGSIIMHNLGNFVADFVDPAIKQEAYKRSALVNAGLLSPDLPDTRTEESVILTCELTPQGPRNVVFVPIIINRTFQPVPATGRDKKRVLDHLDNISMALSDLELEVYRDLQRISLSTSMERARLSIDMIRRLHRVRPRHALLLVRYLWATMHKSNPH